MTVHTEITVGRRPLFDRTTAPAGPNPVPDTIREITSVLDLHLVDQRRRPLRPGPHRRERREDAGLSVAKFLRRSYIELDLAGLHDRILGLYRTAAPPWATARGYKNRPGRTTRLAPAGLFFRAAAPNAMWTRRARTHYLAPVRRTWPRFGVLLRCIENELKLHIAVHKDWWKLGILLCVVWAIECRLEGNNMLQNDGSAGHGRRVARRRPSSGSRGDWMVERRLNWPCLRR